MPKHQHIAPTGVKIDPYLKSRLEKLSASKKRTVHWLMLEAIEHYVTAEEKAEKLRQETLSRWQEAERSLTVNHERVVNWLETWGTTQERKRPSCD